MNSKFEKLDHGIVRIDTGYFEEGRAACYLLKHQGEVVLIETGVTATLSRVLDLMADLAIEPDAIRYIIPTHVHLDHAGGAGAMMATFPAARLIIHPRGARHMISPEKLVAGTIAVYGERRFSELYGRILPVAEDRVIVANDGFTLPLGDRELLFRDSPGHANHHFVVWDPVSEGWFTGDTFGISYREMRSDRGQMILPSTTPVQFDPDKLIASVKMIMDSQPKYAYLTHYGRISGLEDLANQLLEKIGLYVEIARCHAGDPNAHGKVAESLTELELGRLRQVNPDLGNQQALELLEMDVELNTQGLLHWVKEQEG